MIPADPISIEVTYTARDLRPFVYKSGARSLILTAVVFFALLFVAYVIGSHFLNENVPQSFRLMLLVSLIAVPLFTVVLNLISLERLARRKARKYGTVMLFVNETGITAREEHRMAALDWKAYKKALEYKDKFVILTGKGGLLIPKRCFGSQESIEAFKILLGVALPGAIEIK